MIDGRPSLSARALHALAVSAGHRIRVTESTITRCTAEGCRRGDDTWTSVVWTSDDAKRAGLAGKQNWSRHPRRMLQARAIAELVQIIAPEVALGLPAVVEELEDDTERPVSVPAKTVRRRTRAAETAVTAPAEPAAPATWQTPAIPAWQPSSAPSAEEPSDPPQPEPQEAPATRGQVQKLAIALGEAGYRERAERLQVISEQLGRDITSSKQLTTREAHQLIDWATNGPPPDDPLPGEEQQ